MPGGCAEPGGQARRSPASDGAGDAAQPPPSTHLLITIGLGLPLCWALCRGDHNAEGSQQPGPQSYRCPSCHGSQLLVAVGRSTEPAAQTLEPAVAAVQRALALNDSLHWSHIVLGYVYLNQQQYEQA